MEESALTEVPTVTDVTPKDESEAPEKAAGDSEDKNQSGKNAETSADDAEKDIGDVGKTTEMTEYPTVMEEITITEVPIVTDETQKQESEALEQSARDSEERKKSGETAETSVDATETNVDDVGKTTENEENTKTVAISTPKETESGKSTDDTENYSELPTVMEEIAVSEVPSVTDDTQKDESEALEQDPGDSEDKEKSREDAETSANAAEEDIGDVKKTTENEENTVTVAQPTIKETDLEKSTEYRIVVEETVVTELPSVTDDAQEDESEAPEQCAGDSEDGKKSGEDAKTSADAAEKDIGDVGEPTENQENTDFKAQSTTKETMSHEDAGMTTDQITQPTIGVTESADVHEDSTNEVKITCDGENSTEDSVKSTDNSEKPLGDVEKAEKSPSPSLSELPPNEKDKMIKLALPRFTELVDLILEQIDSENVNLSDLDILYDNYKVLGVLDKVEKFFIAMQSGCKMIDIRVPEICLKIGKKCFSDLDFDGKLKIVVAVFKRRNELNIGLLNQSSVYPGFSMELNSVLNNEITSTVSGSESQVKSIVENISWCFIVSAKSTIYQAFLLALEGKEAPAIIAQVLRFFTPISSVMDNGRPLLLVALNRIFDKEIANSRDEEKETNYFNLLMALTRTTKTALMPVLNATLPLRLMIIPKLEDEKEKVRLSMLGIANRMLKSSSHDIGWTNKMAATDIWDGRNAEEVPKCIMELPPLIVTLGKVFTTAKGRGAQQEAGLALKTIHAVLTAEEKKEESVKFSETTMEYLDVKLSESRWEFKFLLVYWIKTMGLEAEEESSGKTFGLGLPNCLYEKLTDGVKSKFDFQPISCSEGKSDHDKSYCVLASLVDLVSVGDADEMLRTLIGKDPKESAGEFVSGRDLAAVLEPRLHNSDLTEWRRYLELIEILEPVQLPQLSRPFSLSKSWMEGYASVCAYGVLVDAVTASLGWKAYESSIDEESSDSKSSDAPKKKELSKGVTDKLVERMAVLLKEAAENLYQKEWDAMQQKEQVKVPESEGGKPAEVSDLWEKYEKSAVKVKGGLTLLMDMGLVLAKAHSLLGSGFGRKKPVVKTPASITALLSMIAQKQAEIVDCFCMGGLINQKVATQVVGTQVNELSLPKQTKTNAKAEAATGSKEVSDSDHKEVAPARSEPPQSEVSRVSAVQSRFPSKGGPETLKMSVAPVSRSGNVITDKKKTKKQRKDDELRKIWDSAPTEVAQEEETVKKPAANPISGSGFERIGRGQSSVTQSVVHPRRGGFTGFYEERSERKPQYFEKSMDHPIIAGELSIRGERSGFPSDRDRPRAGYDRGGRSERPSRGGSHQPRSLQVHDPSEFPALSGSHEAAFGAPRQSPPKDSGAWGACRFPNSGGDRGGVRGGMESRAVERVPSSTRGRFGALTDNAGFIQGSQSLKGTFPSSYRGRITASSYGELKERPSQDVRSMAQGSSVPMQRPPMIRRQSERERIVPKAFENPTQAENRLNPKAAAFVPNQQRNTGQSSNAYKSLYPGNSEQQKVMEACVDKGTVEVVKRQSRRGNGRQLSSSGSGTGPPPMRSASGRYNSGSEKERAVGREGSDDRIQSGRGRGKGQRKEWRRQPPDTQSITPEPAQPQAS